MEEKEMLENVEHCIKNFNGKMVDCIAVGNMYEKYVEQKDEINKLNKMIDEMAEFIWNYDCCNHFAEIRIKCKMKGFEATLGNCKNNCIKPYFRKKVENE